MAESTLLPPTPSTPPPPVHSPQLPSASHSPLSPRSRARQLQQSRPYDHGGAPLDRGFSQSSRHSHGGGGGGGARISRPTTPNSQHQNNRFQHKVTLINRLKSLGRDVKEKMQDLNPVHTSNNDSPSNNNKTSNSHSSQNAVGRLPPTPGAPLARRPSTYTQNSTTRAGSRSSSFPTPLQPQRPAIKLRLVTFNMHDDLPTGDMTDLLGDVRNAKLRSYSSSTSQSALSGSSEAGNTRKGKKGRSMSLGGTGRSGIATVDVDGEEMEEDGLEEQSIFNVPVAANLPMLDLGSSGHPYHLVVVAGQECPTASGVLAGRTPRRWDGKGWTSVLENWLCGGCDDDGDFDEDDEDNYDPNHYDEDVDSQSFAGGGGEGSERWDGETDTEAASIRSSRAGAPSIATEDGRASLAGGAGGRSGKGGRKRGPYILVEKERLMGIYLAVFVLRSCDGFIRGTSKARVTAGLLGGRLGNKGGVGISLSFAGSRLLFISAHLAAHASGLEIRKANIKKIFEELDIDDFLGEEEERCVNVGAGGGEKGGKEGGGGVGKKRELTERFDQTFFMGDLNMRLNITRIHADFLLKSPAGFPDALKFDQLRDVMAEQPSVLGGFSEGAINFAPTYKYDVPQSTKHHRRKTLVKRMVLKRTNTNKSTTTMKDKDRDAGNVSDTASVREPPSDSEATHLAPPLSNGRDADSLSVISSNESVSSTMSDYDRANKDPMLFSNLPEATVDAVRRAQVRFLTLVRSNSAFAQSRPIPSFSEPSPHTTSKQVLGGAFQQQNGEIGSGATTPEAWSQSPRRPILRPTQSEVVSQMLPSKEPFEACFDSSRKQRVQSYTDRILFRSMVGHGKEPQQAEFHSTLLETLNGLHPVITTPLSHDDDDRQIDSRHSFSPFSGVADDIRHYRFGNLFHRNHGTTGLTSRSVESLDDKPTAPAGLLRSRSLNSPKNRRQALAVSTLASESDGPMARFKRTFVQSPTNIETAPQLPLVSPNDIDESGASTPVPATPRNAGTPPDELTPVTPPFSTPTSPQSKTGKARARQNTWDSPQPDRPPISPSTRVVTSDPNAALQSRRRSSLADLPARGQSATQPAVGTASTFFRANTLSRSMSRASVGPTIQGRFKSFLHSLPIPFLTTTAATPIPSRSVTSAPGGVLPKIGPKEGEIQVLEYNAVTDLNKMGAISDHRPVFLVAAIGLGEPEEGQDEEG